MRKWAKLEQKLKEVDDHNKQTGRDRRTWKFHNEMTACMGSSPKINPAVTIDTSSIVLTPSTASGSSSSSSFHGVIHEKRANIRRIQICFLIFLKTETSGTRASFCLVVFPGRL